MSLPPYDYSRSGLAGDLTSHLKDKDGDLFLQPENGPVIPVHAHIMAGLFRIPMHQVLSCV